MISYSFTNYFAINTLIYSFPLNQPDLVEKWLKKICLEGWTPGPENVICEEHFSLDSFEIINDKRILKSEALPSMIDDWRRIVDDDILEVNAFHV